MGEQAHKPNTQPRCATRLIRLPEVLNRVGLGRSTIYRWMSQGQFPQPVSLGSHAVAWKEADVDEWIKSRTGEV